MSLVSSAETTFFYELRCQSSGCSLCHLYGEPRVISQSASVLEIWHLVPLSNAILQNNCTPLVLLPLLTKNKQTKTKTLHLSISHGKALVTILLWRITSFILSIQLKHTHYRKSEKFSYTHKIINTCMIFLAVINLLSSSESPINAFWLPPTLQYCLFLSCFYRLLP